MTLAFVYNNHCWNEIQIPPASETLKDPPPPSFSDPLSLTLFLPQWLLFCSLNPLTYSDLRASAFAALSGHSCFSERHSPAAPHHTSLLYFS